MCVSACRFLSKKQTQIVWRRGQCQLNCLKHLYSWWWMCWSNDLCTERMPNQTKCKHGFAPEAMNYGASHVHNQMYFAAMFVWTCVSRDELREKKGLARGTCYCTHLHTYPCKSMCGRTMCPRATILLDFVVCPWMCCRVGSIFCPAYRIQKNMHPRRRASGCAWLCLCVTMFVCVHVHGPVCEHARVRAYLCICSHISVNAI